MKRLAITNKRFTFGGHNTFPLRFSWLPRVLKELKYDPTLLKDINRERAMSLMGLGSNMLVALKYWLEVTGLVNIDSAGVSINDLGEVLLGADGDPYLEDEVTLWVLHWLIASNAEYATGFFWFFNEFTNPRFDEKTVVKALQDFNKNQLKINRSVTTLKSDLSTLLRMYTLSSRKQNNETLDSPFISLGLINSHSSGYNSIRSIRSTLPAVVIHYVLQSIAKQRQLDVFPVKSLLHNSEGWPNIGGVFRLNEAGLMEILNRTITVYPGFYRLSDTAGLSQLLINKKVKSPESILKTYYQKNVGAL